MDDVAVYEAEVGDCMRRFVQPGDLAIDAGASLGHHARLLSRLVGERGRVLAIEPERESYEQLVRNVGGLSNVTCLRTALWSHDQPALRLWSIGVAGYTSVHRYDDAVGLEVEARALDSLLDRQPTFIKLDVEGAELEALRGAERVLARGVDAVVLELNFHLMQQMGRSDHGIRDLMAALHYDMFLIGVPGFPGQVRVEPAVEIKLAGGHRHINVLFSTEEQVRRRW